MTDTANLGLPCIDAAQAQKHVTHNEALRILDTLVQLAVLDRDLGDPPGAPAEGDRYIVQASPAPTGGWSGHGDAIAAWQDGGWQFSTPRTGWLVYVVDEAMLLAWDGSAWQPALDLAGGISELQDLSLLGIGTSADTTNPLSAKLNNVLWTAKTVAEGGDGNLRYKLSKESAAKTLSYLFQDNFSGRAEIGLTGDDDFHFKVSADGTSWLDAIVIDKTTGKLTFGQGFGDPAAVRAKAYAAPFDALAYGGLQVNGGVDISQELGTTGATLTNNTNKYTADQWEAMYNHGAATAVVTSAQLAAGSFPAALAGYSFAHQIKATTAITSPANGDFARHRQQIEGYRIARLGWGTAAAQAVAIGFWLYSTAAGTSFIRLSNAAGNRAYHREIAVAAGWNWIAQTIPGDTAGTWQVTTSAGLIVDIFSAGKTASPATPDAWSATPAIQTTNSTNLLGTNNNLTLVTGLVVLPGIELPAADRAALLMRPFSNELTECYRYFHQWPSMNALCSYSDPTPTAYFVPQILFPKMRVTPSGLKNIGGTTTLGRRDGGASYTFTGFTMAPVDAENWTNCVATGLSAQPTKNDLHVITYVAANARL